VIARKRAPGVQGAGGKRSGACPGARMEEEFIADEEVG